MPDAQSIQLLQIQRDGSLVTELAVPEEVKQVCAMTVQHHERTTFEPPWVGYVAIEGTTFIGFGGFKTPPQNGSVEIAYGVIPAHQLKGNGTRIARALIEIARRANNQLVITAQTLPGPNPSCSILKKIGFTHTRQLEVPEDGLVWEWCLPADRRSFEPASI